MATRLFYKEVGTDGPYKELGKLSHDINPFECMDKSDDGITLNGFRAGFSISGSATVSPESAKQIRNFLNRLRLSDKEKKQMFYAVTHKGAIRIKMGFDINNKDAKKDIDTREIYIIRPSVLRRVLKYLKGNKFEYTIIEKFNPKDILILNKFDIAANNVGINMNW